MADTLLSQVEDLTRKLLWVPCEPSHELQVQEDLEALRRMVRWIQAVLDDAEKREIHDKSVGLWLKEIKAVAYDAQDVLEEYEYERLQTKYVEAKVQADDEARHLPSEQEHQEVSELAVALTSVDASFGGKIANKIRKIRDRFEEISKDRDALHLREGDGEKQFQKIAADRPPSSHIVDAPTIYGRKDDLEMVINRLLYSHECENRNLSVLPIVGMGGVGKTTFVQHVYNDPRTCGHFQLKGWVCVSDDFDVEKLTARIIESLTKEKCHVKELSVLQEKLKELLDGKRFLLVLDDVWNEKASLWESLQKPFRFGAQRSAVITSTRNESVAKVMQTMPFHRLDCLSIDDCCAVFIKCAFVDREPNDHQDLMEIGNKIVRKCGGLPLAAKSLGGLIRCENDVDRWEEVLQSEIWDLGDQADEVIPALRLSYLHLPSYLKQCFLYTSIFPKDFLFIKDVLIQLWMAQGFVRRRGNKQVEDVGNMYFNELVQRSFFQCDSSPHEESTHFVMHDLIHDLAVHISGEECFQMDRENEHVPNPYEVRHLSVLDQRFGDILMMLHSLSHHTPWAVRTLLVRPTDEGLMPDLKFSCQTMPHLQFLRALDMTGSSIHELPNSICNLRLLRYLNLSETMVARLPDSICKLYKLQTLSLVKCSWLTSLPEGIEDLCSLRCLKIEGTKLFLLPSGIGRLTSLRTLDEFIVGIQWPVLDWVLREREEEESNHLVFQAVNVDCCGIEELKDLVHLSGSLTISNLHCVMDAEDAKVADLRNKRNIRELTLQWYGELLGDPTLLDSQIQVMENLRPPDRLVGLRIEGYDSLKLASWMVDDLSSFSKLVRVQISGCNGCTSLPPLGQLPSLKHLHIAAMRMVEVVGPEFYGHASVGFPVLEELQFSAMGHWVTWELSGGRGNFPCLRRLDVYYCPMLESLVPLYLLPALQELRISRCAALTSIVLTSSPSSSSSSSLSSSFIGPPPLRKVTLKDCPKVRFSPDNEQLLLLRPLLQDLNFYSDCCVLAEWWHNRPKRG